MVHAPASVATPPVAPSTPFPSVIHLESQPAVQAPPDTREALVAGLDTRARTDGPSSNAAAGGLGRAVNGGTGMNASARAHSPPIWNVNSLLPGNPDVHIRTPAQPTIADATGVGGQPQANAGNAGRGAGARGNTGRGRGTGARRNAGRGSGARGNAGRGTGERGNATRGRGARGRGGRASAGCGTDVGSSGDSANGQGAHGVTGNGGRDNGVNANGGTGNGPVNRPCIRRRQVDVVPHTARNGSREGSEGASDEDDEDDADDADDSWNDDDENYLSNSLSALNEEEAEDNERVRGMRRDIEVPIADWNRLVVDDTTAAKREMCYRILYGVSEATMKKYRGWANEYKRFMAHELPKLDAGRFGEEAALRNANPDEIGAALEQNMGGDWKIAEGNEQWLHGPETNLWRLRKYVTFLANETVAQADRMATLKRPEKTLKKRCQCTPAMLMGRLNALNLLIKLDGAIFRKPVLNPLRDFAECRIWVRVQCKDYNCKMVKKQKLEKQDTAGLSILKELDGEARMAVALGLELVATHKRVKELEGLLEDRSRKLAAKDERVNDLEAQLSRLTVSSSGPTADPSLADTPGAAAEPAKTTTPTDQGTRKKPAQPTREETIRDAIVLPWVNAAKPSDGWKLYKSTHPLIGESPESLIAQPRGAVTRLAELIGKAGGGPNAINHVKRVMDLIAHRVEQGDNLAVVLDKLDLVSVAVGMSGVSEGAAAKKKSFDLTLSELKKGSPAEVQLRVKWMLVRDHFIDASLPASEFAVAWPQYCAQMPRLD
ncbi:unnamed protein product [Closterium sp. NIES-64]|nr:unnamed protein product [Closterium sp. NIES-64]